MHARILVVDDDDEIRTSLRRGLLFEGFEVALAADGAEALGASATPRPTSSSST